MKKTRVVRGWAWSGEEITAELPSLAGCLRILRGYKQRGILDHVSFLGINLYRRRGEESMRTGLTIWYIQIAARMSRDCSLVVGRSGCSLSRALAEVMMHVDWLDRTGCQGYVLVSTSKEELP
jgi:hypothetical protein